MSEWRTIESAPKDGTKIIVLIDPYYDERRTVRIVVWAANVGCWSTEAEGWLRIDDVMYWIPLPAFRSSNYDYGEVFPTHWMPLPAPPTAIEASTAAQLGDGE